MNLQDIPYIIYAEETPNPSSIKFVANKVLINEKGASAEYKNISETETAPIAKKLFQIIYSLYETLLKFSFKLISLRFFIILELNLLS